MTEEQRILWIRTILAMSGSGPQRRAFIDGYNEQPLANFPSAQMRQCHALGKEVTTLLNGAGS